MYKKFPQQNYIYTGEKPEMNRGDSSIESDSFNELEEESEKGSEKEYDIISSENFFEIPKESKIPSIQIPNSDIDLFPQNKQGLFYSATKDTETAGLRLNSNNKEDNFSVKNKFKFNNENNRYSNINYLCKNNCRFLNSLQNEYDSDDEDIVNNEISVNFFGDSINGDNKLKEDNQIEIILDNNNLSKIYNNSEISNNNIIINKNYNIINNINLNKDKINEIKNENILKKNEINENIKNIIQNIHKNKNEWNEKYEKKNINNNIPLSNKDNNDSKYNYSLENKENFIRNAQYDTEININLDINQLKKSNKKEKIIEIDKNKIYNRYNDSSKNLNNKFFEIKNIQKSINNSLLKSKSSRNINISLKRKKYRNILNLTKKYKIFQTFLTIGIDTSGLYTLDDEMNLFLLNPKITYNYPYNNLEKELE